MKFEDFWCRGRSIVSKLLLYSFFLFLVGFFLFPDIRSHHKYFSFAVLLPSMLVLGPFVRLAARNSLYQAIVVFCIYMAASGLWGDQLGATYLKSLLAIVSVFVFVTLFVGWSLEQGQLVDQLLRVVWSIAALAAILSLIVFYWSHSFPSERVVSVGRLVHNIPAAAAYAMAGFFVGYYAMQARRHQKIFYGVLLWLPGLLCGGSAEQSGSHRHGGGVAGVASVPRTCPLEADGGWIVVSCHHPVAGLPRVT